MMVVCEEYFCMVITYGIILSCFRCLVVSALVRMWRRLRFLWMLIYVGPFVLLRGYSETLSVFEVTICVCFHCLVLCMAKRKTVRSLSCILTRTRRRVAGVIMVRERKFRQTVYLICNLETV
jgi:hypothetical protein